MRTVFAYPQKITNWWLKFNAAFFAATAVINTLSFFIEILPLQVQLKLSERFWARLLIAETIASVILGGCYTMYWQRKEKTVPLAFSRTNATLLGILRYWLAFSFCTYGFAKILKTQFAHSFWRTDTLIGSLSGFELTWNYFSYSYALSFIIGLIQIAGGILLLFRRTTLLGVTLLLPVIINILLINLFYHIDPGAFLNSILYTAGLLFLLSRRWHELCKVFFAKTLQRPDAKKWFTAGLLKIIPVATAFVIIFQSVLRENPSAFTGKWKVEKYIRNGDTLSANAWLNDATTWTTVYMEQFGRMSIAANPYVFDPYNAQWGEYAYDKKTHRIRVIVSRGSERDTIDARVEQYDPGKMKWQGSYGKDSLLVILALTIPTSNTQ